MSYIVPRFVHVLLMFQLYFMFCIEKGYPQRELRKQRSMGGNTDIYFIVAVTVIVTLILLKFCILAILVYLFN